MATAQASSEPTLGFPPKGSLKRFPFARLIREIAGSKLTGSLYLLSTQTKKVVFFEAGQPVFVRSNVLSECLGQILAHEGLITQEQCEQTLEAIRRTGKKQGELLVEMGILSEGNLRYGLEAQLRAKLFDIFAWDDGRYQFKRDTPDLQFGIKLDISAEGVIVEAIQDQYPDERARKSLADAMDKFPLAHADVAADGASLSLLPEEQHFMACLDGSRVAKEILESPPEPSVPSAAALLFGLISAGVVRLSDEAQPARPTPDSPAFGASTASDDVLAPSFDATNVVTEYEDTPLPGELPKAPGLLGDHEDDFAGVEDSGLHARVEPPDSVFAAEGDGIDETFGDELEIESQIELLDPSELEIDPDFDDSDFPSDNDADNDNDDDDNEGAAVGVSAEAPSEPAPPPAVVATPEPTAEPTAEPVPEQPPNLKAVLAHAPSRPYSPDTTETGKSRYEAAATQIDPALTADGISFDVDDPISIDPVPLATPAGPASTPPKLDADDDLALELGDMDGDDDLLLDDGADTVLPSPMPPAELSPPRREADADLDDVDLGDIDGDLALDDIDGLELGEIGGGPVGAPAVPLSSSTGPQLPVEDAALMDFDDLDAVDLGGFEPLDARPGPNLIESIEPVSIEPMSVEPDSMESEAISDLDDLDEVDESPEVLGARRFNDAETALGETHYDEAVALLEEAYDNGFDVAELHAMLAYARFMASGEDRATAQHAFELLDYAQNMDPSLDLVHAYRGAIFRATGQADRARESLDRALELNPYCELAMEIMDSLG